MEDTSEKKDFIFINMVESLEKVLGSENNIMALIELIDTDRYLQLRANIIEVFDVGIDSQFTGEVSDEIEFGDVSDAVRLTTFALYPHDSTDTFKVISKEERKLWCEQIIEKMDSSAQI